MPRISVAAAAVAGALMARPAQAQPAPAPPQSTSAVAGWDAFIDRMRKLPDQLLAKLPPEQQRDPQVQQEVARIALGSLAAAMLESLGSDGDHPAFVANQNLTLPYPQPNGDTVYRVTRVTPGGTYRLRGERGSLRMANIGQAGPMPGEPGASKPGEGAPRGASARAVFDLNALHVDKHGRFDVIASEVRPAGYTGDWWQLASGTTRLLLRTVKASPEERDPTIAIERTDLAVNRSRTTAAVLEQRLRDLPRAAGFLPSIFVSTGTRLRAEGYLHKFKLVDAAQNGGLAGQSYYSSAYELADDEALLISVRPPAKCRYRSIQLASELEETLDWHNNQRGLNDVQAKPDKDGILRIVVSARDPGVANWLDTGGYPRGIIEGRWMDCDSHPVPSVEKLALGDLRGHLPADTVRVSSAQREAIIRDRRAAAQQRPLW